MNGTILLPDNWTLPAGVSFNASTTQGLADQGTYYYNSNGNNFEDNTYTAEQWAAMEANGAVFLPAAGYRLGTDVYDVGSDGYYWAATPSGTGNAFNLDFGSSYLDPQGLDVRFIGFSVRLVQAAPSNPTAIDNTYISTKAQKRIVNGQLLIEKNGKMFNALGAEGK